MGVMPLRAIHLPSFGSSLPGRTKQRFSHLGKAGVVSLSPISVSALPQVPFGGVLHLCSLDTSTCLCLCPLHLESTLGRAAFSWLSDPRDVLSAGRVSLCDNLVGFVAEVLFINSKNQTESVTADVGSVDVFEPLHGLVINSDSVDFS